MMITFSGLDGAGKSTLIRDLRSFLENQNQRTVILTMYDDITFYSFIRKIRDSLKKKFKLPMGNDLPDPRSLPPSEMNDPKTNVSDKTGRITKIIYTIFRSRLARSLCLFMDLLVLLLYRFYEEIFHSRVLITDRYFYDSLADIMDMRSKGWFFVRLFLLLIPTPDAPVLIDVPAEVAFQRKPEYPLDYTRWRHGAYHQIFQWVKKPLILPNQDLQQSTQILKNFVQQKMATQPL